MGGDGTQPRMTAQDRPLNDRLANDRLDSWKEIAAYLNKEVRTVQRWEKNLGLPVRRLAQGKQGTVFAYKLDLDAWWQESQTKLEDDDDRPDAGATSTSESSIGSGAPGSDIVVLAAAADRLEKDSPDSDRSGRIRPEKDRAGEGSAVDRPPDLIRRLTVLFLLIIVAAGVASVAARFWLQTPGGVPRAKMVLAVRPFKNMSGDPGRTLSPMDSPRK